MKDLSRAAVVFFFLLSPFFIQAANPLQVTINEIAWMGREESFADEWIELYNNADNAINLKGWILKAVDGTPEINLEGTILAKSFYLLERTNDDTVPSIKADLIYKGSLSNEGEYLELINPKGEIIDEIDCSSRWFAGDNKTKQTMERIDSEGWQISRNPGGTPKTKNSPGAKLEEKSIETETNLPLVLASKQIPEKPLFLPLLIAFVIAVFSGIIILILKRE
jgi:hypothetical protein